MHRGNAIQAAFCFLFLSLASQAAEVDERETIQKAFLLSASGPRQVMVDAVNGSIEVTGYQGNEVQVIVQKRLRAESPEQAAEAKRDVKLDISQQGDSVRFYVDGPFRCRDGSMRGEWWRRGYQVNFDFALKVPLDTHLRLKTVNDGRIKIENTSGDYDVHNINGGIEMLEVSGSGRAYALNGGVRALFSKNPRSACYFGSLNGQVNVFFQPDFSADLRFKTFNGSVFTDFSVTYLPRSTPVAERRDGKYIYKSDGWFGVRAGNGGPELKFEAFNGDIRIQSRGK